MGNASRIPYKQITNYLTLLTYLHTVVLRGLGPTLVAWVPSELGTTTSNLTYLLIP